MTVRRRKKKEERKKERQREKREIDLTLGSSENACFALPARNTVQIRLKAANTVPTVSTREVLSKYQE